MEGSSEDVPEAFEQALSRVGYHLVSVSPVHERDEPAPRPAASGHPEEAGSRSGSRAVWYLLSVAGLVAMAAGGYLVFLAYAQGLFHGAGPLSLLGLAVVAGVATFFSPCSFPLLPAYLTEFHDIAARGTDRQGASPVGLGALAALGVLTFAAVLGVVVVALGEGFARSLSITTEDPSALTRGLRAGIGGLLILLGLYQVVGGTLRADWMDALAGRGSRAPAGGRPGLASYVYGLGYVTAALGCAGPISAGLVAFALTLGGTGAAAVAFTLYGVTLGLLMFGVSVVIGAGRPDLVRRLSPQTGHIKVAGGVVLLLAGAFTAYTAWDVDLFRRALFP